MKKPYVSFQFYDTSGRTVCTVTQVFTVTYCSHCKWLFLIENDKSANLILEAIFDEESSFLNENDIIDNLKCFAETAESLCCV